MRLRPRNTQGCSPSDLKPVLLHADKKRTHLTDPNPPPSIRRGEYSDEQYAESVLASRQQGKTETSPPPPLTGTARENVYPYILRALSRVCQPVFRVA